MADKIFTKYTVKKKDLFMTLINHMKSVGWQRLNEGHPSTGNTEFIMYSLGESGDTPIYVDLAPYDGANVIGNESYNIMTTDYTDGVIRIGQGYDNTSGALLGPYMSGWTTFSFLPGRNYVNDQSSYARQYNKEFDMDMYIYADKNFVVFVVVPFLYTNLANCITFFGIPEKSYLEEVKSPSFTNVIFGSSGRFYGGSNVIAVLERPKSFTRNNGGYTCNVLSVLSPYSPNVDGVFQLSDIYYTKGDEGIRGMIGNGFYILPLGGAVDGDIIEVGEGENIQRYRYTVLGSANNNYTSLPTLAVAIRIS